MKFDMGPADRRELWAAVTAAAEKYYAGTALYPVAPELEVDRIRSYIADFAAEQHTPEEAIAHVVRGMTEYAVHTPHPGYFGLFNPRAGFPGILADTLTAVFNPQLAAWGHAPFAAEVEAYLVRYFGAKFGLADPDGVFTSGGTEANLTALLCALNNAFPDYAGTGLQGLQARPLVYCSAESHHSIVKALRVAGMGSEAVRTVAVVADLAMDTAELSRMIAADLQNGYYPLMVIATAGTTGAGAIDPLEEISVIAKRTGSLFHVDAAYGGALVLSSHAEWLNGIEKADSITFDAHKWLSVPMGTSMLLTPHRTVLGRTFRVTTEYMPKEAGALEVTDPYVHSIQWSRRFNGLKIYLSLLILGEEAFRETIDQQIETGDLLRSCLTGAGWTLYNHARVPVVCFGRLGFDDPALAGKISSRIIRNGKAWLSVYPIGGRSLLRACITNYNTGAGEIEVLIGELNTAFNEIS